MHFADLVLAKRLERAEGFACAQQAEARHRISPQSNAEWVECAGAFAIFDGVDSPCTQTFGLGLLEELTHATLDAVENFFLKHGAPVIHEVSPFAGVEALALLCERGYRPVELTSVLYQPVAKPETAAHDSVTVRIAGPDEAELWSRVSTEGWAHDHPEFAGLLMELGLVTATREQTVCFLAELNGRPGAAGALCPHEGVALFGGASTIPALRRRGLQAALLRERMSCAFDRGCDLAMMCAAPGSDSQRNAERAGFRVAYTRTKWQLHR